MEKIIYSPQVWDLHVHTPYKYNKSANSYDNDSNDKFVEKIVEIIKKSSKSLKMISFTDHNYFNKDVYNNFKSTIMGMDIQIIPGIEMDLKMSASDRKSKHILFYFQESCDYDKISKILNEFISKKENITFDEFVTYLFENGLKFAISPHAFKQGIRGIQTEWNDDNDEKNYQRIKMYSSNFFVFWEADKGSVPYARDFIEKYYGEGGEAITNFSDSHTYSCFESYLNNPTQYFYALNNFNGILMASSETNRIVSKPQEMLLKEQKIKQIIIDDKKIFLSDKLNVIIGGRGKGKSILLDKIGFYFKCNESMKRNVGSSRIKFLNKFNIKIKNFFDNDVNDDFKVKYLEQSYIDTLFKDESSKQIEIYFQEEFESISIQDKDLIFSELKKSLLLINKESIINKNVAGISDSLINSITKNINSLDENKEVKFLDLFIKEEKNNLKFNEYFRNKIPDEIFDTEIENDIQLLTRDILKKIINYNIEELKTNKLEQIAYEIVKTKNEKLDKDLMNKNNTIDNIKNKLKNEYDQRLYIVRIINKLYETTEKMTKLKIEYKEFPGEDENKFYFIKYNNIEHPIEFARRIMIDAINGIIVPKKELITNKQLFLYLLDDQNIYNSSFTKDSILSTLKQLKGIKIESKNKIIHYIFKENIYQDLSISSPGMQTNSLMEYIFHQKSDIPLLIDQPEDNVDNESRYKKLTKWIKKVKNHRQIILVSHDANIVVNGDTENLIIADCINSQFSYTYGALEYGNNIEKAAIILDGGKDAIRKRIQKYGE